jgi:hypothetical protein
VVRLGEQGDGSLPTIQDVAAFIAEVQRLVPTSKVGLYCNRSDVDVDQRQGWRWAVDCAVRRHRSRTQRPTGCSGSTPTSPLDLRTSKFTNEVDLLKWATVAVLKPVQPDVFQPPVVEPKPENVGVWVVDPAKVSTVLLGRDGGGTIGRELSPGTTISDGVAFVKNSVGRYALLRSDGYSYDREFLTQTGAGPVARPFPVIPDYDIDERIKFRGRLTCRCVAVSLPWVEHAMLEAGVIKFNIDLYQGGYNTSVSASYGTHAKGGNTDVGQYSDAALKVWREMGWTIQRRTVAQGFTGAHGHGWPKGCTHLAPAAVDQRTSWENGRDGLRQNQPITGPAPKGKATPTWDAALSAYLKQVGA